MSHPIGAIGFQCMYYQTTETDRHRETQGKHCDAPCSPCLCGLKFQTRSIGATQLEIDINSMTTRQTIHYVVPVPG